MEVLKNALGKIIELIAGISMAVVFVITFAQVISRYVFQLNIPWSTDIIRIMFIYTVFFGASLGMRDKGHLCMDLLMTILPKRAQPFLSIVINVGLIAFLVFIVYFGIQFTAGAASQGMPYLQIPISALYIAIPLNAVFMIFYLCLQIYEQCQGLRVPRTR